MWWAVTPHFSLIRSFFLLYLILLWNALAMEISALLISKISVLPMNQFGFLHRTGQPDISVQMWVPYIDVNFIGNVIFLTFGGCTWIPSTGKISNFCRFLLSLHLTTNMDNNVASCFNKIPVLQRQSSAFQKLQRCRELGEGTCTGFPLLGSFLGIQIKEFGRLHTPKGECLPRVWKYGKWAESHVPSQNYKELSLQFCGWMVSVQKQLPSLFILQVVTLSLQFLAGWSCCLVIDVEVKDHCSRDFNSCPSRSPERLAQGDWVVEL